MLKSCCALLFLLFPCAAAAQYPGDEYYPYAEREERRELLTTDSTIFYRAVQSPSDLYGLRTGFNLPQVALRRRGLDYTLERTSLMGVAVSYRYLAALRLLGAEEQRYAGLAAAPGEPAAAGGMRAFRFSDGEPLQPFLASVRFTDRNYLVGAKAAVSASPGDGWRISAALDARSGRDMHVEGVFTNAVTAGLRLARRFGEGHELSVLCIVPPSVRGTRLSSSEEAFTLTGDRLYNPAWGWQDGRVRNSRVRRETVPLALAAYAVPLSASTSLAATLAAEAGVAKYSMLDWYDARTPMPDNYRYLPSYTGDRETEQAWLARDPRYTQIDWDELIRQNRMAGGHAVYALEDRVERLCNLAFDASFATEADARLTLRYGVSLRRENTRSYKQMRDLLGAGYVTDIDRFLIDDDTYGNLLQNDLRHPGRTVREGDRFGYDYALTLRGAALRLQADYRSDRFRADLSVVLGSDAVSRRGYYEKELFPGGQSYGPSRVMRFTPYTLKAAAGWAFSPRRYIEIAAAAAARTPRAGDLFFQPLYNNRTVDNPVPERIYAAELNCRLTGPVVDFQAAFFAAMTLDGIETRTYYDDMASVYCDMAVTGVGRMSCGAEAAADIRLSYRWLLSLAASAGRYEYIRDPRVTVLSGRRRAGREPYGRLRDGRRPAADRSGGDRLVRPERVGMPRFGRICRAALRRTDAPAPHRPHRGSGRYHTGVFRRLHPAGAAAGRLHARCRAVQVVPVRTFAAHRVADAAQPDGRSRYGLWRLRVAARAPHPPGRRHALRAPRLALHLCVAPFVLSYNLLPVLIRT